MIIRKETAADFDAIMNVTLAADRKAKLGKQNGYGTLAELRRAGLLTLSLVAELDDTIVGHIAFCPIKISGAKKGWYALGPISVLPECQSQGIRKALIAEGIEMIKEMHGKGCAFVGDPDYFKPLGFQNAPGLIAESASGDDLMVLPFGEGLPQGRLELPEGYLASL